MAKLSCDKYYDEDSQSVLNPQNVPENIFSYYLVCPNEHTKSEHIFSCYLIFLPPCLYLYSLRIPMYVLSLSSVVTVFGKAGGKENIIFFHSMREGGGL